MFNLKQYMYLFTMMTFVFYSTVSMSYAGKILKDNVELKIFRNGKKVKLNNADVEPIKNQIITLFNSCPLNTNQEQIRSFWENDGKTIEDIWKDNIAGSYFSIDSKKSKKFSQFIFGINEDKPTFGAVMAKMPSGEIRGYVKCHGLEFIKLLCMEEALKYLPDHYSENKYNRTTFSCPTTENNTNTRIE